jgi:hypothetical protein
MNTRSEIVTQAGRLIGRPDTNFQGTLQDFLNQSIRDWARKRPWASLKRRLTVYATGSRFLILPSFVERPVQVFDVSNIHPVESGGNWDFEFPSALATQTNGIPIEWQDMGTVATISDPSDYISVESDNSGDTEEIRISGFSHVSEASGTALEYEVVHESIALSGTSAVTSTHNYVEVLTIGKANDTTGKVSVRSGGSLLARLNRYETQARYRRIEFIRVPNSGTQFEITALFKPNELEHDSQTPHPSIEGDFLLWSTAGFGLMSIGERQAGLFYLQKAQAILEQTDFRDKNFGDQFHRMIPIVDAYQAEEDAVE